MGTGSIRIRLLAPRRRKLARIVVAALGACTLILVAAVVVHLARPKDDASAFAATPNATTAAAQAAPAQPALAQPVAALPAAGQPAGTPSPAGAAPAAAPAAEPTTGTIHLLKPAVPGKVWLDGQKISALTETVACGSHQLKVGAHGKARPVDVPCGGDLKIAH
jgi:hypothetical protein